MINKSFLEDLPDEILIEICLYLNTFDILYTFGRLNRRLQCTISEFRSQLNLSLFTFDEFQRLYCPSLLNFVCERLIKLTLSNDSTPGQIELFEKLMNNECFKNKLPYLESLKLIEFTNDNITILSKILYIKELHIEFNSYEKITKKTENLINLYLFGLHNNFEKINLYYDHGLKINPQIQGNKQLEELSIQVNTLDDLSILFTVVPCLIRLEVDILSNGPLIPIVSDKMPKYLKELYLHTQSKVILPFQTIFRQLISSIPSIEYLSLGMKTSDPDYANATYWIDLIELMPNLRNFILGLEIDITADLVIQFDVDTADELKQAVFNLFYQYSTYFPVSIYTNNQTLFIDSIPYQFNRDQSYSTCPEAAHALITDITAAQQSSHRILGLSITGEHKPIIINDYLNVIHRFPRIQWLCLNSINILDMNKTEDFISPICLKLKNLKSLFYMRSTLCKINRTLFDQFFYDQKKLDTLRIMYGDLMYLLRTASPSINGIHIKYLAILCSGADGSIRLIDLQNLISTFPSLEYLCIDITSSNLIKKNQLEIINQLIISFKQLRSFRIVCQRGCFKSVYILMKDEQIKFKWLSYIHALGSHLILQPKCITLWKSHCQTTYF